MSVAVINLDFKFELMRVKEDPVSNRAKSLKRLIVTVEIAVSYTHLTLPTTPYV